MPGAELSHQWPKGMKRTNVRTIRIMNNTSAPSKNNINDKSICIHDGDGDDDSVSSVLKMLKEKSQMALPSIPPAA
jgi:hypothetical protein